MQGDTTTLDLLNGILTNELTAINQYFLHARILQHWGLERLGRYVYDESIGEMKHADALVTRILFLDGQPMMHQLHPMRIGKTLPEMLQSDLALESKNRSDLQTAIRQTENISDFQTRAILQAILADTEEHIDWLETQQDLIARIGLENYQQAQMHPAA